MEKEKDLDFEAKIETFDSSDMTEEQKQEFLNGTPTRGDVASFVEHYFTDQVLPELFRYIDLKNALSVSQSSIALSILIKSGVITREDVAFLIVTHKQEVEQNFAKEHKQ